MSCCTLPVNLFKRRSGKTEVPARDDEQTEPPARDDEETEPPVRDDEEVETVEQPAASAAESPSGSPQPLEPGLDGEELEAGERPETHGSENPPETSDPPGSGPARGDEGLVLLERSGTPAPVPAPDDKSPIWSHSVTRFAEEQGEKFELIKSSVDRIQDVDRGRWDTWLNQKPATSSDWIRKLSGFARNK
ncbi:hypothetical protein V8F06_007011 [Rhypophila decipiens]